MRSSFQRNAGKLLSEILNSDMNTVMLGHLSKENNYEAGL